MGPTKIMQLFTTPMQYIPVSPSSNYGNFISIFILVVFSIHYVKTTVAIYLHSYLL